MPCGGGRFRCPYCSSDTITPDGVVPNLSLRAAVDELLRTFAAKERDRGCSAGTILGGNCRCSQAGTWDPRVVEVLLKVLLVRQLKQL